MTAILVVERSGLVAADIKECVREAGLGTSISHVRTMAGANGFAGTSGGVKLAIVTSHANRLFESPLGEWLLQSGVQIILGAPSAHIAIPEHVHYLPSPFTSQSLIELLISVSRGGGLIADSDRPGSQP